MKNTGKRGRGRPKGSKNSRASRFSPEKPPRISKAQLRAQHKREQRAAWELERVKYAEMIRQLLTKSKLNLGERLGTTAAKLDVVLMDVIPDNNKRYRILRRLFSGRFQKGDLLYIQILWDFCRNADVWSARICKKYKPNGQV